MTGAKVAYESSADILHPMSSRAYRSPGGYIKEGPSTRVLRTLSPHFAKASRGRQDDIEKTDRGGDWA